MPNDKIKPRNLSAGDQILVTRRGAELLVASTKRDSFPARVMTPPDVVDSPTGGRRGYALTTDAGRIPFVTGVSSIMMPTQADIRRHERESADREQARSESAGLLAGLDAPADAPPLALPSRAPVAARASAPVPMPSAPSASRVARDQSIPYARGANAAANYRAMARGATTDAAQAFWERLASEALA